MEYRLTIKPSIFFLILLSVIMLFLFVGCGLNGKKETSPLDLSQALTTNPQSSPTPPPRSPASFCPPNISLLIFNLNPAGDPQPQTITFTNCGGPARWSSSVKMVTGKSWLSIRPQRGWLGSGASRTVQVNVVSKNLAISTYKGYVAITLGSSTTKTEIDLAPFSFHHLPIFAGQFSCGGVFTIGAGQEDQEPIGNIPFSGGSYSWSATTSTADGTSWLFVSSGTGFFLPQGPLPLVIIKAEDLGPGDYKGDIIFTIGANANTFDCSVDLHVEPAVSLTPTPTSTPTPAPGG